MKRGVPKINQKEAAAIDPRVLRSRAGLGQALLALLESTPLEQITIRDIAAKAGVGFTTYYRHYPSKEALLQELAADEIRRMSDLSIPVRDATDSRAACLALCTHVHQQRVLWSALLTGAFGFVREEMLRQSRELVVGQTQGWLPGDLGLVLATSSIVELLAWWLRQPAPPSVAVMADIMDRIVIAPTMPASAPDREPAPDTADQ